MPSRYTSIDTILDKVPVSKKETLGYQTVKYPEIPLSINDIYVITTLGDRLDSLAQQFYSDVNLYWIISSANPDALNLGSLFVAPGTELRIPTDVSTIKFLFNQLNNI
jgi:hypothetical protein